MGSSLSAFKNGLAVGTVLLLGTLITGCASSHSASSEQSTAQPSPPSAEVEGKLRSAADEWRGAPHEWGGTSRQGVDCSGLVQSVYETEFQLSLPRSTEKQVKTGRKVSRSSLQPGDLVFFRHERKKYHVGIYLSNGEFLHASSSEGVTISPLDRTYWNERWWQARRLLNTSADSTEGVPASSRPQSGSSEIGW